jgi:Fe-S protein assembly co-chaperone HscB
MNLSISLTQLQETRPDITAFSILGIPPRYDIDLVQLENHYQMLQTELHPDKYIQKSPLERESAKNMSGWINQAYKILKSPVERAMELLKSKSIVLADITQNNKSSETMTWVFELREQIQESSLVAELIEIQNNVIDETTEIEKKLNVYFNYETEELIHIYTRFSYLHKMMAEINTKLKSLQASL